jgi:hypothetical protein
VLAKLQPLVFSVVFVEQEPGVSTRSPSTDAPHAMPMLS